MSVFAYAKAIAALLGSIVTGLLAVLPPDEYQWLVIVGVIATTVATFAIPNALPEDAPGKHEA
ncbi:hypothetical protein [Pseudarthrobacter sp. PS3-L1]|uniref:hypothetical protein n=1 Tax=Pseudarthrobacter sp. PS3-L1 TaxID=3046207 RepID=UPI0024B9AE7A|nr:hypothetical protein [Pseudarthrobacter sp. PS3-L1]MDJ0321644.1 hypothetical protein [Pseudarthrobacter sp. PS3-L1]